MGRKWVDKVVGAFLKKALTGSESPGSWLSEKLEWTVEDVC